MPSWPTLSRLFLFVSPELWSVVTTEPDKTTSKLHTSTENGQAAAEARLRPARELWKPRLVVSYGALCYGLAHAFSPSSTGSERMIQFRSGGRLASLMHVFPPIRSHPRYRALLACVLCMMFGLLVPLSVAAQTTGNSQGRLALDFNDVELSVFVRFISELTGKNFVLDDAVKKAGGKITVFSPTKVTPDQAYSLFVSALEVSRLAVVPRGPVHQIVQMGELPPERGVFVYKLKHANATDLAAVLTNLVARSQTVSQTTPGIRPPIRPLTEFEAPVQVFADKATNSIIISSTKTALRQTPIGHS